MATPGCVSVFTASNLLSNLPMPACEIDRAGIMTDCNWNFALISGRSSDAIRGEAFSALAHKIEHELTIVDQTHQRAPCSQVDINGVRYKMYASVSEDQSHTLCLFEPHCCECPSGNPEANQALINLQALLSNAPVAILYSKDRRVQHFNEAFLSMFRCDARLAQGYPTPELYPSESAYALISEQAGPLLSAGRPFRQEILLRRLDGSLFWAEAVAYLIHPADPAQGSIWILNDISARKAAEKALFDALQETQAILENAAVGIVFTRDKVIQRINRCAETLFGFAPGELVGQPARVIYPSDASYEDIGRQAGPLLGQGQAYLGECEYRRKNGTLAWCRVYAKAIDATHNTRGTVWLLEDISDARHNRLELEQSLKERQAFMDNAPVGVLVTRNRRILQHNKRFAEMFGYTSGKASGRFARELYRTDAEYTALGEKAGPLLSKAEPVISELYMRHQDGHDLWINLIGYVADPTETDRATFWILEDRTDFKRAEEALSAAYAEQSLIFDHSVVGIAFVKHRRIQRCNRRYEQIYGFPAGSLTGQSTRISYPSDEAYQVASKHVYEVLGSGKAYSREFIHKQPNGHPIWIRITGNALDATQPNEGSIWNVEDITERKLVEESIRESELLQRAILNSANIMILTTDHQGNTLTANPAAAKMLESDDQAMIGQPFSALLFSPESLTELTASIAETLNTAHFDKPMDALLARPRLGQIEQREALISSPSGKTTAVELSISPLYRTQSANTGFLVIARDITDRKISEQALIQERDALALSASKHMAALETEVQERRRAEIRLRFQATHDPLTHLPNRAAIQHHLRNSIAESREQEGGFTLLLIDLDRFKLVNDTLGHRAGDSLLKAVAQRLQSRLRASDMLGRLGGDEYVVLTALSKHAPVAPQHLAANVLKALAAPFTIDGNELFISASIGISQFPQDGQTVDALLQNADTAMYRSKAHGRNTFTLFEQGMSADLASALTLEGEMRRALEQDEFVVHYQPIYDYQEKTITLAEALVRWQHPKRGLLAPGHFISIAEDRGLIGAIGHKVLQQACRQIRAWQDQGWQPPIISINLSPLQFRDPGLIESILKVLNEFDVRPSQLKLEITETTLMQDADETLVTLEQLAAMGFLLSVDDFGTGYSSLAYLKKFPVDSLKIDRSFVQDMITGTHDQAIVSAIIGLAKNLGLAVIAEGVETHEQFKALHALGCNYAQGYYLSRPCPAAQIQAFQISDALKEIA